MPVLDLTPFHWTLAAISALCIGIAKSGFSGIGLVSILLMARVFPPRESTGIVLPLLICGDLLAICMFRRKANWAHIRRTLPIAMVGVVVGALLMSSLDDFAFNRIVGGVVLGMIALQCVNRIWPAVFEPYPNLSVLPAPTLIPPGLTPGFSDYSRTKSSPAS